MGFCLSRCIPDGDMAAELDAELDATNDSVADRKNGTPFYSNSLLSVRIHSWCRINYVEFANVGRGCQMPHCYWRRSQRTHFQRIVPRQCCGCQEDENVIYSRETICKGGDGDGSEIEATRMGRYCDVELKIVKAIS